MTTKVTIEPAGHTIEVTLTEGSASSPRTSTEVLDAGTPSRDFWIHSDRVMTIREVTPA